MWSIVSLALLGMSFVLVRMLLAKRRWPPTRDRVERWRPIYEARIAKLEGEARQQRGEHDRLREQIADARADVDRAGERAARSEADRAEAERERERLLDMLAAMTVRKVARSISPDDDDEAGGNMAALRMQKP